MDTSLRPEHIRPVVERLSVANREFRRRHPGDLGRRQPVHVMYGGAHLFKAGTARKLGDLALRSLEAYGPDFATFARVLSLPGASELPRALPAVEALAQHCVEDPGSVRANDPHAWLAHAVYTRVREKLEREAVEDFRIDFEDGYGYRPNTEEDEHAVAAAQEAAQAMEQDLLPPYFGFRVKPFSEETWVRALRTLDLFLTTLVKKTGGRLPANFVVALPKVTHPEQGAALAEILTRLENELRLRPGAIQVEVMIETPQILLDADGSSAIPALARAVGRRLRGAHFGAFDYTAALNVSATYQSMVHEACDFARLMMQNALAGTGVWIADGVTTLMPIPPHRPNDDRPDLSERQQEENQDVVWAAWKVHYDNVRHALAQGIYQGWDLHPAQLPARYAAIHTLFLHGIDAAAQRLRNFMDMAAQATRVGAVFDDAATGQGLLNHFLRAIHAGAITEEEAVGLTGLNLEEFHSRSFAKILQRRNCRERLRHRTANDPELDDVDNAKDDGAEDDIARDDGEEDRSPMGETGDELPEDLTDNQPEEPAAVERGEGR